MRHVRVWSSVALSAALVLGVWASAHSYEPGEGGAGPQVGDPAPAFALASAECETVALEDYAGKPVAVVFYRGQW
jgi:hypothetical protein